MSKAKSIFIAIVTNKKVLGIVKAGLIAGLTALGLTVTPEVQEVFCATTVAAQ